MGYRVVTMKQFSGKINRFKSNGVVNELILWDTVRLVRL